MGTRDRNQNKQPVPREMPRRSAAARNPRAPQKRIPREQGEPTVQRPQETQRRPAQTAAGKKERKRVYSARRNKYRKVKIGILYTVMILAILTAGIAIGVSVLFKIDTIQVVGESRYDPQKIISLSGVEKGENLITIDTAQGETAIMSQMPYLETVRIKRQIPSTVNIEITEAQAAGCIAYQNQYVIISGSGRVLELSQTPLKGLPVIKGAVIKEAELSQKIVLEDETVLTLISDIETARAAAGLTPVTEFDLTNPVSPTVTYDGRIIIKLGIPTDLEYKLQTAVAVLASEDMKTAQRGTLDVSLAADKGRSYFKPDYGASSQAAANTDTESQSEVTSDQTTSGSDQAETPENSAGDSAVSDSGADLETTGGESTEVSAQGQENSDDTSALQESDSGTSSQGDVDLSATTAE